MKRFFLSAMLLCSFALASHAELVDGIYHISTSDDFLAFKSYVEETDNGVEAVLDADIVLPVGAPLMIGSTMRPYCGVFHGGKHKVTVNFVATGDGCALFNRIIGEIENLKIDGTIQTAYKYAAAFAVETCGYTELTNCLSSVTINSSVQGDGTHAGFVAVDKSNSCTFRNCIFNGTLNGSNTNSCAQFCGWMEHGQNVVMINCGALGSHTINTADCRTFARGSGNATYTDCYYITTMGSNPTGVRQVSQDEANVMIENQYNDVDGTTVPKTYDLPLTAKDDQSDLFAKIGMENLDKVTRLKISGTINGWDIMIIRNNLHNLTYLDLSDATIVANDKEYYTGCHTQDSIIGERMFQDLSKTSKLSVVKIPRNTKKILYNAFNGCGLTSITMYDGLTGIGQNAFCNNNLLSVEIPNSVKIIGTNSFSLSSLTSVVLPKYVERINDWAFRNAKITELEIPSSVTYIGGDAFYGCPLEEIRVKVVSPFEIDQNAFDAKTYLNARLRIPMDDEWTATFNKYYFHTQWGQFTYKEGWQPTIDNFYLDNDYELPSGSIGNDGDTPDAEFKPGSAIIVTDDGKQDMDEVHVVIDGDKGASIIDSNDGISIDILYCDINVVKNKWYFFCFPFDVTLDDVLAPGNWRFRYYDGKERADNARGGWKNLPNDQKKLDAGIGYIFQTNKDGVLTIPVSQPDFKAMAENQKELISNPSANHQDASWNFVGNPYLSYYSIDNLKGDFDAPLTIWNGSSYEAVRPGDDDFLLQPYQAFFVQKPSAKDYVGFNPENQTTYTKGNKELAKAKARRAKAQVNPDRLLVNLTVSDGENTDKTRIVFNDRQQMGYEMECDAVKFASTEIVPQLYSTHKNVNYAINERPNGNREVQLGFSTKKDGEFTISAVRMDTPMLLKDTEQNVTFDLSVGEYTFTAKAGTYNNRFVLMPATDAATAISNVNADAESNAYDLSGRRTEKVQKGVQIVNGKKILVK